MKDLLKDPQQPYTKALLSVIPVPNPRLRKKRIVLQGETSNPVNLPPGCCIHPRCPLAMDICKQNDPALLQLNESHQAACLLLVK
jgi:oligopeptide/dipeptide ABC transporter ATP-binding protein